MFTRVMDLNKQCLLVVVEDYGTGNIRSASVLGTSKVSFFNLILDCIRYCWLCN